MNYYLREIYETIAEELEINIDDVTEEDFADYVCDKMSAEETTFSYNKKDDKVEFIHDFRLEGY